MNTPTPSIPTQEPGALLLETSVHAVALHSSDSSTNRLWHVETNVPVQAGRLGVDLCLNLLSDGVDRFAKSFATVEEPINELLVTVSVVHRALTIFNDPTCSSVG